MNHGCCSSDWDHLNSHKKCEKVVSLYSLRKHTGVKHHLLIDSPPESHFYMKIYENVSLIQKIQQPEMQYYIHIRIAK